MALGELVHAVLRRARHRARRRAAWCRRAARPRCRAAPARAQSYLRFCPIFRTDGVLQQRLQQRRAPRRSGPAAMHAAAAESKSPPAAAMRRAARSRPCPAPRASEKPTSSACMGSRLVVSVSKAKRPAARASAIQLRAGRASSRSRNCCDRAAEPLRVASYSCSSGRRSAPGADGGEPAAGVMSRLAPCAVPTRRRTSRAVAAARLRALRRCAASAC